MEEVVSLITVTNNRPEFLKDQYENMLSQTYKHWKWYIDDDSDLINEFFENLKDDRVDYYYNQDGVSVGYRRNNLISKSKGNVISIIDDDDHYTEKYLEVMLSYLVGDVEFVKINSFYIYNSNIKKFGFWNLSQNLGICYNVNNDKVDKIYLESGEYNNFGDISENDTSKWNDWQKGYSFAYMFKREIFENVKFSDKRFMDDTDFTISAIDNNVNIFALNDKQGLVLHLQHGNNLSSSFPQKIIPNSILNVKFPNYKIK